MKKAKTGFYISLVLLACSAAGPAAATEMVYYPLNPSFGGNPLNGPVLLNEAQAQNKYTDPDAGGGSDLAGATPQTPLQQFNDMLERSILSRLTSSAVSSIVGADGALKPGTVETGNFTIGIVDMGGGMLQITTTDKTSGASTSFEVSSL